MGQDEIVYLMLGSKVRILLTLTLIPCIGTGVGVYAAATDEWLWAALLGFATAWWVLVVMNVLFVRRWYEAIRAHEFTAPIEEDRP